MGKGFWIILIGVIALMIGSFVIFREDTSAPSGPVENPHEITAEDHTLGPDDAPLKLIKYSDFQCPHCEDADEVLRDIKEEFSDDLQLVYRHFHVTSPEQHSFDASRATVAAEKQDSFWEMHRMIFDHQSEWSQDPSARQTFTSYAEELNLDMEQYQEDFENAGPRVERDLNIAEQLGVSSTPTFYLNGEKVENLDTFDDLRNILKKELENKKEAEESETEQ